MEEPPGFEPGMEVLQTSALPLGYGSSEADAGLPERPPVSQGRGSSLGALRRVARGNPPQRGGLDTGHCWQACGRSALELVRRLLYRGTSADEAGPALMMRYPFTLSLLAGLLALGSGCVRDRDDNGDTRTEIEETKDRAAEQRAKLEKKNDELAASEGDKAAERRRFADETDKKLRELDEKITSLRGQIPGAGRPRGRRGARRPRGAAPRSRQRPRPGPGGPRQLPAGGRERLH